MKKLIILAIPLLFLASCSDFEPLIDLKASEGEKAKHAQEDHMECEWLIEKFTEGWFKDDAEMVRKCLDGRGHSVITDGNKIVVATSSDDASKIIGIVSTNPTVLGDADVERWMYKYERDDYGSFVWEDHTVTEWTDADGKDYSYDTDKIPSDLTVPSDATVISEEEDRYGNTIKFKRKKLNPEWDSSKQYISRQDRKEWEAIGLMGKLRLKKGEPVNPNWIKLRDISDTVEEWLVR